MENKFENEPKTVSENTIVTRKVENAKKEGITKGALTTGIISIILLMLLSVLVWSLYKKEHNSQLALMEEQKIVFFRAVNCTRLYDQRLAGSLR